MEPQTFYTPTDRGFEKRVAERMAWWERAQRRNAAMSDWDEVCRFACTLPDVVMVTATARRRPR